MDESVDAFVEAMRRIGLKFFLDALWVGHTGSRKCGY